ncbi:3-oxoacid CoA-transferase subunit B [Elusimicrobiota bacterium]
MKEGFSKEQIAARAAREIKDGMYVNLGIGIPNLIPEFLGNKDVIIHSENGLVGMGPLAGSGEEDPDLINAAKQPVTIKPGGAICSQSDSFVIIRGGHLDMTVLGAFQVSEKGDLANWNVPVKGSIPGVGGAMDLVAATKTVVVTMTHCSKNGDPKILKECTYPLTGKKCVDIIITDIACIKVTDEGLLLTEVAPGLTAEDVQEVTDAQLIIDDNIKEMCADQQPA